MSTAARRRLMRDFKKLQDDPPNESFSIILLNLFYKRCYCRSKGR